MTVAVHQPNYLPWLGYFYKIYASDVFIFHDLAEHSKRYPTRRTRIRTHKTGDETTYLTVPLLSHSDFTPIKDLKINYRQDWPGKHLRKIKNAYAGAPFFEEYFPLVEKWLGTATAFSTLAGLNIFLIRQVLDLLEIETKLHQASELEMENIAPDFNLSLTRHFHGTIYLSGGGGRNYQDEALFEKAGIRLAYSPVGANLKQQRRIMGELSILEGLFHLGKEELLAIFSSFQPEFS